MEYDKSRAAAQENGCGREEMGQMDMHLTEELREQLQEAETVVIGA